MVKHIHKFKNVHVSKASSTKHMDSVWCTNTSAGLLVQLERDTFSPLTPRPVYIMEFHARLWNQGSLVHANRWDSSTMLCHLIKEGLIMLSLTNTGRPYGAWRFFGSSGDTHNTVLWAMKKVIFLCEVPQALPTHCNCLWVFLTYL